MTANEAPADVERAFALIDVALRSHPLRNSAEGALAVLRAGFAASAAERERLEGDIRSEEREKLRAALRMAFDWDALLPDDFGKKYPDIADKPIARKFEVFDRLRAALSSGQGGEERDG